MDTFGIAFNSTLQQYKASKKTPTEEEKTKPKPADSNDPFSKFENAISGIFVSMGQKIKTVTETAGNAIASGAKGLWEGTKNLFAGIGNGISKLAGNVGNLFKPNKQVADSDDLPQILLASNDMSGYNYMNGEYAYNTVKNEFGVDQADSM